MLSKYSYFSAGLDTINAMLQFVVAEAVMHPEVQEKLGTEAEKVLGKYTHTHTHIHTHTHTHTQTCTNTHIHIYIYHTYSLHMHILWFFPLDLIIFR